MNTTTRTRNATTKQIDFIRTLLGRADADNGPESVNAFNEFLARPDHAFTTRDASAMIDTLLTEERNRVHAATRATAPSHEDVLAGRYAVTTGDTTTLYRVDRPDHGRWDGYTFVNEVDTDGENIRPVKGGERGKVLALIARDPVTLSRSYGQETGTCGVCGRTLTDPESITAGIGPVCAARF